MDALLREQDERVLQNSHLGDRPPRAFLMVIGAALRTAGNFAVFPCAGQLYNRQLYEAAREQNLQVVQDRDGILHFSRK